MTPSHASETAYAKINLALHVRMRRADGYHELETVFAFAEDGDRLTVAPAEGLSLTITGRFAKGLSADADNLVLRAARLLQQRCGVGQGAAFTLDKQLPVAAGIGGGSADAAAALRLAARLWGLDATQLLTADLGAELGADVPACIASQTCIGTGVGEQLLPFADAAISGRAVLLVNPLIACPTGPVFRQWDGMDRGPLDFACWLRGRNDLEKPAIALHPEIAEVLRQLDMTKPDLARMSGSGATCFGLFGSCGASADAARMIRSAHPDWWVKPTILR